MTTSTPKIRPWQIRVAYVKFPDKPKKGNSRPVLILAVDDDFAYGLKITTKNSDKYARIKLDHEKLGLEKPSWLQLDPIHMIPLSKVRDFISKVPLDLAETINEKMAETN